jgi:hypothetical protein
VCCIGATDRKMEHRCPILDVTWNGGPLMMSLTVFGENVFGVWYLGYYWGYGQSKRLDQNPLVIYNLQESAKPKEQNGIEPRCSRIDRKNSRFSETPASPSIRGIMNAKQLRVLVKTLLNVLIGHTPNNTPDIIPQNTFSLPCSFHLPESYQ